MDKKINSGLNPLELLKRLDGIGVELLTDLADVIGKHDLDSKLNISDMNLACFLVDCLGAFGRGISGRDLVLDRNVKPGVIENTLSYEEEKRKEWEDRYGGEEEPFVSWEEFDESYIKCADCGGWDDLSCSCFDKLQ